MNHVGHSELDFVPRPWGMMSFEFQMNQRCIGSGHVSTIIVKSANNDFISPFNINFVSCRNLTKVPKSEDDLQVSKGFIVPM